MPTVLVDGPFYHDNKKRFATIRARYGLRFIRDSKWGDFSWVNDEGELKGEYSRDMEKDALIEAKLSWSGAKGDPIWEEVLDWCEGFCQEVKDKSRVDQINEELDALDDHWKGKIRGEREYKRAPQFWLDKMHVDWQVERRKLLELIAKEEDGESRFGGLL